MHVMFIFFFLVLIASGSSCFPEDRPLQRKPLVADVPVSFPITKAVVLLAGANTGVTGVLHLQQEGSGPVEIKGTVSGLTPGLHGFHVHMSGDIATKGCDSTGAHYNPGNVVHGSRTANIRHNGDLGNIEADQNGNANVDIVDHVVSLTGPTNIIGRAFVVHANADDLGLGQDEGSSKTGNAGARVACGVIGIV